jgi:DNA-binding response OmpR family regulator
LRSLAGTWASGGSGEHRRREARGGRAGDPARDEYVALAGGRPLALTGRELELLTALARREGRIVSREELLAVVWRQPYRKCDRSVDVYVRKLRGKLEEALPGWCFIHTHFGFGYRFAAQRVRGRT